MDVDLAQLDPRLAIAAEQVDLAEATLGRLAQPRSSLAVSMPVRFDDGQIRILTGYRARWDDTCGPGKGGVRFHPSVDRPQIERLALGMTIKTALLDLPYGGAKGGVRVDPKACSTSEVERIARGWVNAVADVLGPERDVPAPDVYTNERIMAWMSDTWRSVTRRHEPATFTGKPLALGGSPGRSTATADGAMHVLHALADKLGIDGTAPTVAIQGFGNGGSQLARLLYDAGWKIMAVSDSGGAVYGRDGLDVPAVQHAKHIARQVTAVYDQSSVCEAPGCEPLDPAELPALDVDVLVPAAMGDAITADAAEGVRARVVLEVANHPTTPEADEVLERRGVTVVPDALASGGGVTVSYFEWVQNRAGLTWTAEEVANRLGERMGESAERTWACAEELGLPLRAAAHAVAIRRIDEAARARDSLQ